MIETKGALLKILVPSAFATHPITTKIGIGFFCLKYNL